MRRTVLAVALAALAAAGCGATPATAKGRLVSNGEPMPVSGQVGVVLTLLEGDGKPTTKSFTAMVKPDGTFEVVASGGELPPGNYQVSLVVPGKPADKFKPLIGDKSPMRRELKPGANELTIDVAKPQG